MDICLAAARAEASRRNGAKSCGPKTPEGKARSAQNALKHGFRAQQCVVLPSESAAEFAALEAALIEELAPEGALQSVLAQRVVAASWRLARAERLEAELFAENQLTGRSLGLALIRDCNGARSFDTLLRYRGGTLAELWRALRTLKALQAERREAAAPDLAVAPARLLAELRELPDRTQQRQKSWRFRPARRSSQPRRTRSDASPRPAAGDSRRNGLAPSADRTQRREQPAKAAPPSRSDRDGRAAEAAVPCPLLDGTGRLWQQERHGCRDHGLRPDTRRTRACAAHSARGGARVARARDCPAEPVRFDGPR